jgi:hypothetical protein
MKKATPMEADKQPVHFKSLTRRTSSFAESVYPIIPLLMKTGTAMALKEPVASATRKTNPRMNSQSVKSRVGVGVLIVERTDKFLVIPILDPPGVSFVQKYPY